MTGKPERSMKSLSEAIKGRRATPSFDGAPIPGEDLRQILDAGLHAPSGYNMQPWRFIVVQSAEQKKKLARGKLQPGQGGRGFGGDRGLRRPRRLAQGPGDDAAAGTRRRHAGELCGAGQHKRSSYLSSFTTEQMKRWLNKQVMLAFTHMMLMAEVLGYDTAPMEGFEQEKVHETLRLPMSYWVVALLAIGHLKGADKFDGGRFDMTHTVFGEEYGKVLKLK